MPKRRLFSTGPPTNDQRAKLDPPEEEIPDMIMTL